MKKCLFVLLSLSSPQTGRHHLLQVPWAPGRASWWGLCPCLLSLPPQPPPTLTLRGLAGDTGGLEAPRLTWEGSPVWSEEGT